MSERLALVATSYVVLCRDEAVLLQLRSQTGYMDGYWAIGAAGHVEPHESAVEAAQREANEELGICVRSDDLEPLCAMHRTGGKGAGTTERVDFFFLARDWFGEPTIREPEKASRIGWFNQDQLPSPFVPHEEVVLEAYFAKRLKPIMLYGFPGLKGA